MEAPPGRHLPSLGDDLLECLEVPLLGRQAQLADVTVQYVVCISSGRDLRSSRHDLRLPSSTTIVQSKDSDAFSPPIRGPTASRCAAAIGRRRKANHAPPNAVALPVPPRFAQLATADASAMEAPPGRHLPSLLDDLLECLEVPLLGRQAQLADVTVQYVVCISSGRDSRSSRHDLRLPSSTTIVQSKDSRPL